MFWREMQLGRLNIPLALKSSAKTRHENSSRPIKRMRNCRPRARLLRPRIRIWAPLYRRCGRWKVLNTDIAMNIWPSSPPLLHFLKRKLWQILCPRDTFPMLCIPHKTPFERQYCTISFTPRAIIGAVSSPFVFRILIVWRNQINK